MVDGLVDALGGRHDDVRHAVDGAVDEDGGAELGDGGAQRVVGGLAGVEQQAVDVPGHLLGERQLLVGPVAVVGAEQGETAAARLELGGLGDGRVEGVGQVVHQQAEVAGPAADQGAGGGVGGVAELVSGAQHALSRGGGDGVGVAEDAGDGRDRHAGAAGDVMDRGA